MFLQLYSIFLFQQLSLYCFTILQGYSFPMAFLTIFIPSHLAFILMKITLSHYHWFPDYRITEIFLVCSHPFWYSSSFNSTLIVLFSGFEILLIEVQLIYWYTEKWLGYTYIVFFRLFSIIGYCRILNIVPFAIVGPCCLSILYIVVCLC